MKDAFIRGNRTKQFTHAPGEFNQRMIKQLAKEFKINEWHSALVLSSLFAASREIIRDDNDMRDILFGGYMRIKLRRWMIDKTKDVFWNKRVYREKFRNEHEVQPIQG